MYRYWILSFWYQCPIWISPHSLSLLALHHHLFIAKQYWSLYICLAHVQYLSYYHSCGMISLWVPTIMNVLLHYAHCTTLRWSSLYAVSCPPFLCCIYIHIYSSCTILTVFQTFEHLTIAFDVYILLSNFKMVDIYIIFINAKLLDIPHLKQKQ